MATSDDFLWLKWYLGCSQAITGCCYQLRNPLSDSHPVLWLMPSGLLWWPCWGVKGKLTQTKCSYPVCLFQAILKFMNTLGAGRGRTEHSERKERQEENILFIRKIVGRKKRLGFSWQAKNFGLWHSNKIQGIPKYRIVGGKTKEAVTGKLSPKLQCHF